VSLLKPICAQLQCEISLDVNEAVERFADELKFIVPSIATRLLNYPARKIDFQGTNENILDEIVNVGYSSVV
jgi:hypothetical protein